MAAFLFKESAHKELSRLAFMLLMFTDRYRLFIIQNIFSTCNTEIKIQPVRDEKRK